MTITFPFLIPNGKYFTRYVNRFDAPWADKLSRMMHFVTALAGEGFVRR